MARKMKMVFFFFESQVHVDDRWLYASYMEDEYRDRLIRSCSFHVIPFYNASVKMIQ